MGAVKNWAWDLICELSEKGYSVEEISKKLDCDISFVKAVLGVD